MCRRKTGLARCVPSKQRDQAVVTRDNAARSAPGQCRNADTPVSGEIAGPIMHFSPGKIQQRVRSAQRFSHLKCIEFITYSRPTGARAHGASTSSSLSFSVSPIPLFLSRSLSGSSQPSSTTCFHVVVIFAFSSSSRASYHHHHHRRRRRPPKRRELRYRTPTRGRESIERGRE